MLSYGLQQFSKGKNHSVWETFAFLYCINTHYERSFKAP